MKKVIKSLLAVFAAFVFFSCSDGSSGSNPDIPSADINDEGSHVNLTESPEENEQIPADSIRNYVKGTGTDWSVYNIFDLAKLSEIVNGGDSLKGITVTLQNDITVNENLLTADYDAPAEAGAGVAAKGFNNLDSIGRFKGNNSKDTAEGGLGEDGIEAPFEGSFDGNGKTISGFYAYQGHQGLGFIGYAKNAVIKNLILKDACIVNYNIWHGIANGEPTHDGYDDDRFGGILGYAGPGTVTIENCFFSGVIGSEDALERGGTVSYTGGLVGEVEGTVEVSRTVVFARIHATKHYAALAGRVKSKTGVFKEDTLTVDGTLIDYYDEVEDSLEADLLKLKAWINAPEYDVTFDADNGSDAVVVKVKEGRVVETPSPAPEKQGFTFLGWFDGNAETAYDFTTPVAAPLTLTAHWEEITQSGGDDPVQGVDPDPVPRDDPASDPEPADPNADGNV